MKQSINFPKIGKFLLHTVKKKWWIDETGNGQNKNYITKRILDLDLTEFPAANCREETIRSERGAMMARADLWAKGSNGGRLGEVKIGVMNLIFEGTQGRGFVHEPIIFAPVFWDGI
uniref:Uncharacterized protein n=1 Tax=Strigamia maritima TaxID=126957 RepID=T1JMN3_STRMM